MILYNVLNSASLVFQTPFHSISTVKLVGLRFCAYKLNVAVHFPFALSFKFSISPIDKTGGLFNLSDSGVDIFSGGVISTIFINFFPPGGIIIE